MSTLTRTVPGMTCGHCVSAVTAEVTKIPGVEHVEVDLETKLVTVTGPSLIDDAATDAALCAAIDEAGFEVG